MKHHLSRRTLLRGVGVTMALPWMESRSVWGDESPAKSSERQARLPFVWRCCFPAADFTPATGGPRALGRRWNSVRCSSR